MQGSGAHGAVSSEGNIGRPAVALKGRMISACFGISAALIDAHRSVSDKCFVSIWLL